MLVICIIGRYVVYGQYSSSQRIAEVWMFLYFISKWNNQ